MNPKPSLEEILMQVEAAERTVKEVHLEKERLSEKVMRNKKQDLLNLQKIKFLSQELEEKRNRIRQLHEVIEKGFQTKNNQMSLVNEKLDREDAVLMIQGKIHQENLKMRNVCMGYQSSIGESLKRGNTIFHQFSGLVNNQGRWLSQLVSLSQKLLEDNELLDRRNTNLKEVLEEKNKQIIEIMTQKKKRDEEVNDLLFNMKREFDEKILNITSKVTSGSNLQVEYYRKKLIQKQQELDNLLSGK